ncbi:MAG: M48 family metallopeptidase [Nitrospirae bacterium]|nr:M48 family metallopeptidase [Nitrospirota bacterium]
MQKIIIGDINIDVVRKVIKNVHLSVYPPLGRVRISAPVRMDMDAIREFAISKLKWIKKHQHRIRSQEREAPREYITGESHYYLGRRYLLRIIEYKASPDVLIKHETIDLYVRPDSSVEKRASILDEWYRKKMKEIVIGLISQYEKVMKVQVSEFGIKKMKTRWGTCGVRAKRIWLNLELAKKPLDCIEYVVVHEMAHLLERNHNDRFKSLLDLYLPKWRSYKDELNRRPLRHEDWSC